MLPIFQPSHQEQRSLSPGELQCSYPHPRASSLPAPSHHPPPHPPAPWGLISPLTQERESGAATVAPCPWPLRAPVLSERASFLIVGASWMFNFRKMSWRASANAPAGGVSMCEGQSI